MKKIEIKETEGIRKYEQQINYEGNTPFKVIEEYYTEEDINQTLGKINDEIELFRYKYHNKPQFIVISKALEILLDRQTKLFNQHERIMLNNEILEINRIFGTICFVSYALHDLEFEVR